MMDENEENLVAPRLHRITVLGLSLPEMLTY